LRLIVISKKEIEEYLETIKNDKPKAIIIISLVIVLFLVVSFFGAGYLPELGRRYAKKTDIFPYVHIILILALSCYGVYVLWKRIRSSRSEVLPSEAIEMLRVIAAMLSPFGNNRQEATIDEIALSETFGMSHQQTKYLLELLDRADTLKANDIGIYGIKHKGRKLLNEKEKMP